MIDVMAVWLVTLAVIASGVFVLISQFAVHFPWLTAPCALIAIREAIVIGASPSGASVDAIAAVSMIVGALLLTPSTIAGFVRNHQRRKAAPEPPVPRAHVRPGR